MTKGTVKVKVTAKRKGKTVRETRTYKTCTARSRRGRAPPARCPTATYG